MSDFVRSRTYAHNLIGRHERHARYRGTARIDISHLRIDGDQQALSLEHVERLRKIFENEGCHRLEPVNRIAALVSQQELTTLVLSSDLSQPNLLHGAETEDEPPKLTIPLNMTLRALHGQHRLKAAKSHFLSHDAWWTVDLFLDDMSTVLITSLREEYSNPEVYSDGDIFRHIRLCHQQKKTFQEMKWWACLTKNKTKDLNKILAVKDIREGFDDLLGVTGLWSSFHIPNMRRYLELKCHEVATDFQKRLIRADRKQELSTYLRRIRHVWSTITGSNSRLMNLVDVATVKHLELRAPAASEQDANFVRSCMESGKIFAQVLDPILRKTIISNICAVERIIPSLWTFLEDIKHLEPCARAIKMLVELHSKSTIYEALCAIFVQPSHDQQRLIRQDGENHFVQMEGGNKDHFEVNYRQLWIFAMRHYSDLINADGEEGSTKESSCVKRPISILWYRFARLALILGFRSRKIELIGSTNALDEAVLGCISWLAGATNDGESPDRQVTEVRDRLQIETDKPPERAPLFVTDRSDLDIQPRCGRPFEAARRQAKLQLFIRWLYDIEEPRGKYITLSFVQRAMFHAFFGHEIRRRDKGAIEHQRANNDLHINEAESMTVSQDTFPARFARDTHIAKSEVAEIGDHDTMEHQLPSEQGCSNPISATLVDVERPPQSSEILSPRNEAEWPQQSLAEMVMMLQQPTTRDLQECSGASMSCSVEEVYSSPIMAPVTQETVIADSCNPLGASTESSPFVLSEISDLTSRSRCGTNSESPISPLALSQRSEHWPSAPGEVVDNTSRLQAGKELLSSLSPALEVASSSEAVVPRKVLRLETLNTSGSPCKAIAAPEQGSMTLEYLTSPPFSMSDSGHEPEITSEISEKSLDLAAATKSMFISTRSSRALDINLPMMELEQSEKVLDPVTAASTKRVREIVEESQSCVHDPTAYSSTSAGRKNSKRSFEEYRGGAQDTSTQRAHINRNEGEDCTAKRHRLSTV